MAHCAMALTVSGFHTAPVGLFGVFTMMAFVCSVRAASMSSMLGSKLAVGAGEHGHGHAAGELHGFPDSWSSTGVGMMTSSPSLSKIWNDS
mgnify:CR=1 FL=1